MTGQTCDATGVPLVPGDLLLNDQGKVWVAQHTDAQIATEKHISVVPARVRAIDNVVVTKPGAAVVHLPAPLLIRVDRRTVSGDPKADARLYHKLYELMAAPRVRAALAARRQAVTDHKARIKEEQ